MAPLWQGAEQHSLTSTSQKSPMKPGGQLRKQIILSNCEAVSPRRRFSFPVGLTHCICKSCLFSLFITNFLPVSCGFLRQSVLLKTDSTFLESWGTQK